MTYKKDPSELVYARRRVSMKVKEFNKMCSKLCSYKTNVVKYKYCPMCKSELEYRKW